MIVRSSFFSSIKECPLKAHYTYDLGLIRHGGFNEDTYFGARLHDAIDIYNKTTDVEDSINYINSLDWPITSRKKSKAVAILLIKQYPKLNLGGYTRVHSEQEFEFNLAGYHTWRGRFDSVLQHPTEDIAVEEDKTTNPRFLQLRPNDQFISYVIGASYKLKKKVRTIIINDFNVEKLSIQRMPITFSDDEIELWLEETHHELDCYESYYYSGIYPKRPSSCLLYGKDHPCQFLMLCSSPPSMTQPLINKFYSINETARELAW